MFDHPATSIPNKNVYLADDFCSIANNHTASSSVDAASYKSIHVAESWVSEKSGSCRL